MADREADGKKILAAFTKAYEAMRECQNLMVDMFEEAKTKNHTQKQLILAALLGTGKATQSVMNELHHALGHQIFKKCWAATEVGEEEGSEDPLDQLLGKLGFELLGVHAFDLDNIPADLPADVKAKVLELKKAHDMSKNAHLH